METFIDKVIKGTAFESEIDVYIQRWHEDRAIKVPVSDYVGMTKAEYSDYIMGKLTITQIVNLHQKNKLK
jgi:hypothetical protein